MPRAYSADLRERAPAACEGGQPKVARRYRAYGGRTTRGGRGSRPRSGAKAGSS